MMHKIFVFILAIIFIIIAFFLYNFLPSYLKYRNSPGIKITCSGNFGCHPIK